MGPLKKRMLAASLALALGLLALPSVNSHGRLIEPPSRSTMWRYGFSTPPNYNDHELYCGGFTRQWEVNKGKCGICGDPWDSKQPRENEAGGRYGGGIIVRKYQRGQAVKVRVELTANHHGYFEFRVCPNNNVKKPASQMCLDQHPLQQSHGAGPRFYVGPGNRIFEMLYQLPKDLTCQQCVMQWRYIAGNNWGMCKNGTGAVGCGPQEEFRACADVAITEEDGTADSTPNRLVDPEVYLPKDTTALNEVDFDDNKATATEDTTDHQSDDEEDADAASGSGSNVGKVLVIVFVSLICVLLCFAGFFFYYVRGGKAYVDNLIQSRQWPDIRPQWTPPPMPRFPKKLPSMVEGMNWPLTNVPLTKLPKFLKTGKVLDKFVVVSRSDHHHHHRGQPGGGPVPSSRLAVGGAQLSSSSTTTYQTEASGLPRPPPRVKKSPPQASTDQPDARLATIGSRAGIPRPGIASSVPPMAPPPPPVLEIGPPMAVTINGVTVETVATKGSWEPQAELPAQVVASKRKKGPSPRVPPVTVPPQPHQDGVQACMTSPPPPPPPPPPPLPAAPPPEFE